jgi:diaminopimelate epimerase
MHGTGNDFILVEPDGPRDWPALARAMCDRHFGVGADGLFLVLPSDKASVKMRLFNADGSEAEVSGNGVRCLVKYAVERGLARPDGGKVTVEAVHGVLEAYVESNGGGVRAVRLSMGAPRFAPQDIPVLTDLSPPIQGLRLEAGGETLSVDCVSMGNPHAVTFTGSPIESYPLDRLGPQVEHHPLFPQRVNFGVARVLDPGHMDLRVWERGCGETLACGSGSCAAVVMAHLRGLVRDRVEVRQPGGVLTVEWHGRGEVLLSGPAAFVFEGDWPSDGVLKGEGAR